ncbi:MAG TPA: hypothetical protein ENN90_13945 [Mariniphaga anaerophila]|uniref:Uncharacterized protein n=1 Tax=Mariniphaga anaerophila TaxID=1484053 RepID=A0A831LTJ4_9BACT|nr:hypothetical protein [Mariniphaga anaerophila]
MKKLSVIIATVLFSFGVANAQTDSNEASHGVEITIPTVAIIDIEGPNGESPTINLTPSIDGLEAGAAVNFSSATNNDLWLNYTSIVKSNQKRNITASIDGNLPAGVSLKVKAGTDASLGNGAAGSPESEITLESTAKNVITGIGSAYTGEGYKNGHQLTYTLDMADESYAKLVAADYNVTVTYTITE